MGKSSLLKDSDILSRGLAMYDACITDAAIGYRVFIFQFALIRFRESESTISDLTIIRFNACALVVEAGSRQVEP